MENLHALVGRPYAFPSHPPETFDCWSLVKYARAQAGLPSPLPYDDQEAWCTPDAIGRAVLLARPAWKILQGPTHMAMAVMDRHHVGVVLGRGVLHALARNSSVVWTSHGAVVRRWPEVEWWNA